MHARQKSELLQLPVHLLQLQCKPE